MSSAFVNDLVDDLRSGLLSPDEVVARLRRLAWADLGFARVDHHRPLRQGLTEAVYGPGKTPEQGAAIVAELLAGGGSPVVLTRAAPAQVDAARERNPGGCAYGLPGLQTVVWRERAPGDERVVLVTAGTADLPVADECAAVLHAYGVVPLRVTDVGVAGIHRLLAVTEPLQEADVVVVVAGMEGALASVVGGLTSAPVVAVPTSVGYGAALDGITALLGMLAGCAAGLTVVGIDNGFGAACAVVRHIAHKGSVQR